MTGHRFPTRAEARRAIFTWINTYHGRRLHSSLGYIQPIETAKPSNRRRRRRRQHRLGRLTPVEFELARHNGDLHAA